MGDCAEMMLDGTCCQYCGEFLLDEDGEIDEAGFPQSCDACHEEETQRNKLSIKVRKQKRNKLSIKVRKQK